MTGFIIRLVVIQFARVNIKQFVKNAFRDVSRISTLDSWNMLGVEFSSVGSYTAS